LAGDIASPEGFRKGLQNRQSKNFLSWHFIFADKRLGSHRNLAIITFKMAVLKAATMRTVMMRLGFHAFLTFVIFTLLAGYDTYNNDEPFALTEFLFEDAPEFMLLAIAVAAASFTAFRLRDSRAEADTLASALRQAVAEGNQWRAAARVHAEGLGLAIQQQFRAWQLSASEGDVAMLMLKGLSHKEIANLRNSSSATVRQQAAAVYVKSGLASRAELAAFFLEDLFPSAPGHAGYGQALPPSDMRSIPASTRPT
jgi:DNA-binding CsgD family transcriptional regulator